MLCVCVCVCPVSVLREGSLTGTPKAREGEGTLVWSLLQTPVPGRALWIHGTRKYSFDPRIPFHKLDGRTFIKKGKRTNWFNLQIPPSQLQLGAGNSRSPCDGQGPSAWGRHSCLLGSVLTRKRGSRSQARWQGTLASGRVCRLEVALAGEGSAADLSVRMWIWKARLREAT